MTYAAPIRAVAATAVTRKRGLPLEIDTIAQAPQSAFLRRAWFAAAGGEVETLLLRRPSGRPIAALPLVPAGPGGRLRAVPGSYWPFRGLPIAVEATDAELVALLAPAPRIWRLGPMLDSDPSLARLARLAPRCGYRVLTRKVGTSFALDIAAARGEGPWPKPSTQRNLHKHEKKLARLGDLDFRFLSGADWNGGLLDALAAIERNAWVGSQTGADRKFADPGMRQGWETALRDPQLAAMLGVGLLTIGGEPAAFSFGLNCGRTRYCIATSYDARFAKYSPGYLTGYWTYQAAAKRGVERLSLGAGDTGDKRSIGAVPEAGIVDCLFVRGALPAALLRPFWRSRR
jgi:CelD/BcsL family acetyltransferase involved in cellulose biosynthesis